jgi:hypothetical protein
VAVSFDEFARELRAFDGRRVVVREMRAQLETYLPPVRAAVQARALETLPTRGGLNEWVAETTLSAVIRAGARKAGIRIKGSRKSLRHKSDMTAIDAGSVRAPAWGRRGLGAWHTEAVTPGFFTVPAADDTRLRAAADVAVDRAFDEIRQG